VNVRCAQLFTKAIDLLEVSILSPLDSVARFFVDGSKCTDYASPTASIVTFFRDLQRKLLLKNFALDFAMKK
jgi:hypothetical protein